MKKHLLLAVLLGVAVTVLSSPIASAQNCNSAPTGYGGAWWRSYSAWCSACGGTPNPAKTSCTPGPNWGRRGGNLPPGNSAADAAAAAEAAAEAETEAERNRLEAERQREIDEQKKREEEEAKRHQKEFERNKQQALRDMGISPGVSGLKDANVDTPGLKDTGAGSFGFKDSLDSSEGGLGFKDDFNSSVQGNPNPSKAKTAQVTMQNNTPNWLNLYIDGEFGCGPVMPRNIGAAGGFCTSSTTPGPHLLEARKNGDSPAAVRTRHITIEHGSSPNWEVNSK